MAISSELTATMRDNKSGNGKHNNLWVTTRTEKICFATRKWENRKQLSYKVVYFPYCLEKK